MCKHFVEDEHYCYFDDMYCLENTMQWIYEAIQKHNLDAESLALLDEGHKEFLQSECYEDYGYPSYFARFSYNNTYYSCPIKIENGGFWFISC